MADALENQVAFQVAVKIVHEFEAVEVHEDQCESAAGACRTFPLCGESFHEEAMSFDSGEAVGDGLLLGLLEAECVVKRTGDQVGESARGSRISSSEKSMGSEDLDVENTVQLFGEKNGKAMADMESASTGLAESIVRGRAVGSRPCCRCVRLADEAGAERNALRPSAPRRLPAFRLDDEFARGVIQHGDADVVVGRAQFQAARSSWQAFRRD